MKRMLCVGLTILLALHMVGGFASTNSAQINELLVDYSALLDAKNQLYAIQQDMIDALETFVEENDYASLVRARIACNSTVRQLKATVLPELGMKDETILALLEMGLELDGLEAEFVAMKTDLKDFLNTAELFEADLYEYVNQEESLQIMRQRVASSKELLGYRIAHDCFALNYLLSPLKDDPAVQQFWKDIAVQYPTIGSGRTNWIESQTELIEKVALNLSKISSQNSKNIQLEKDYQLVVSHIKDAFVSEDLQSVQKKMDLVTIKKMPTAVVNPTNWLNWEHAEIITKEETSDKSDLPSMLMKQTESVSLEAFMDYYKSLSDVYKENGSLEGSDEAGWKAEFIIDSAAFTLEWKPDETVFVTYDPHVLTMEPEWYGKSMP